MLLAASICSAFSYSGCFGNAAILERRRVRRYKTSRLVFHGFVLPWCCSRCFGRCPEVLLVDRGVVRVYLGVVPVVSRVFRWHEGAFIDCCARRARMKT